MKLCCCIIVSGVLSSCNIAQSLSLEIIHIHVSVVTALSVATLKWGRGILISRLYKSVHLFALQRNLYNENILDDDIIETIIQAESMDDEKLINPTTFHSAEYSYVPLV